MLLIVSQDELLVAQEVEGERTAISTKSAKIDIPWRHIDPTDTSEGKFFSLDISRLASAVAIGVAKTAEERFIDWLMTTNRHNGGNAQDGNSGDDQGDEHQQHSPDSQDADDQDDGRDADYQDDGEDASSSDEDSSDEDSSEEEG